MKIVDRQLFPIYHVMWLSFVGFEENSCEEDDQYGSEKRCEKRIGYEEERINL